MTATKICTVCGTEYERKKGIGKKQWENSRFCGYACYWASKKTPTPPKPCAHCGEMMERPAGQFSDATWDAKKFCGDACANPSRVERMKRVAAERKIPLEQRFWNYVDRRGDDECWEWQGALNTWGYGVTGETVDTNKDRTLSSHRVAYELTYGQIPEGLLVRHSCHNRKCCNPEHLSIGTHKDNHDDAKAVGRHTHGEKSGRAKLTETQAKHILQYAPYLSDTELGKIHGVDKATVYCIRTGRTWKHLHRTGHVD